MRMAHEGAVMNPTTPPPDRSAAEARLREVLEAGPSAEGLNRRLAESLEDAVWQGESLEGLCQGLRSLRESTPGQKVELQDILGEMSDEVLALCIKKNDLLGPTFEELFVRRYSVLMTRWIVRWQGHGAEIDDLVQQLVVRFYENRLRDYDASRDFRSYARRCAHNLWVQELRKRRPRTELFFPEEIPGRDLSPEVAAQRNELAARVRLAITRLPAEQRAVMERAVLGDKAEEIALALKIAKARVFKLLFHARRRVEQLLSPSIRRP